MKRKFYRIMIILFTDPFNARVCYTVLTIVALFYGYVIIRVILNT